MGLSNKLFCEAGSFSCCLNLHRFLQPQILRLYFPILEPWFVRSVLLPTCSSWLIRRQMWDHPVCQPSPYCQSCPPRCPFPPPLQVWMNVCSLTPWLSDFHVVQFSGSSGYFFKFVIVLLLVVQGGKVYLPMPPT